MKVIKIGAVWCSGCLVMKPRWQKIEKQIPWLITEYFDFDSDIESIKKYHLEGSRLPTFIFLDKNGKEFIRLHGEASEKKIMSLLKENKKR